MHACGLPVAAAKVGVFAGDEAHSAAFLYEAGKPNELREKMRKFVRRQTEAGSPFPQLETWGDRAKSLNQSLRRVV